MLRGHLNEAVAAAESAMTHGESRPPIYYTVLARAYMRDGRFADAKRIAAQAQAANSEDLDLHQILHSMAIAERDQPTLTREGEWLSKQQSTWSFMESQAVYAADQGKLTESERLFPEAAAEALHENLPELAEGIREDLVTVEIQLGHNKKAVEVMRQFRDPDPLNQAGFEADLGLFADAKKHLREAQASAPTPIKSADGTTTTNTIQTYIQIPYAQASIALHRGNPRQAIALLEPARPYEFAAPAIISLRGQAYLLLGDGVHAAAEFQRLIDYPGLEDPMYPQTCIAHLQLARAYVLQNKADIARVEYRKFFDLWEDADPDLPALAQARSEYAKLDSSRRY
jgi:tetratricopeptide (TPR) repeat protein